MLESDVKALDAEMRLLGKGLQCGEVLVVLRGKGGRLTAIHGDISDRHTFYSLTNDESEGSASYKLPSDEHIHLRVHCEVEVSPI